jgi:flavodoxin/ferredoxin
MIYYFSGTGNSKHIAEKISDATGDRVVFMSENTIAAHEIYEITEKERIGFIFPVYWYCIPTIVEKFIKQLKLSGYQNQYVYAIASYGIAAGNRLIEILAKKQLKLCSIFGVKMVDNYVIGYNVAKEASQIKTTQKAEIEIDKIIAMINAHTPIEYIKKGGIAFLTPITSFAYRRTDHTKKFYTTEACTQCNQCVKDCPCNVIRMKNNRPEWTGECTFCLKCIHSCKQSAIQYGRFTKNRNRYLYVNE